MLAKNRYLLFQPKKTAVNIVHRGLFFQASSSLASAHDFPIPSEAGQNEVPGLERLARITDKFHALTRPQSGSIRFRDGTFGLPQGIDADNPKAKFKKGVLKVTIRKKRAALSSLAPLSGRPSRPDVIKTSPPTRDARSPSFRYALVLLTSKSANNQRLKGCAGA